MNWIDLKTKIDAASPGDVIEIPKDIGPPPSGPIAIPKGVTVVLSDPLPIVQIFGEIDFYPKTVIDKMNEPEWWGKPKPKDV